VTAESSNPAPVPRPRLRGMKNHIDVRPGARLQHRSMADETTAMLRRMIMLGELKPGERVTQDGLSEQLGVSTMPVREALLRLAAEGLIEALANRSFTVVRLSREDFEDIYWVQSILMGELAKRACANATPDMIEAAAGLRSEFEAARKDTKIELMESVNWRWQELISDTANASRLTILLRTVLRYTPEGLYASNEGWIRESIRYQTAMLAAFRAGDIARAADAATDHVLRASRILIKNHPTSVFWEPSIGEA
jgi:DNA-binding GntR family transcriptional regulator